MTHNTRAWSMVALVAGFLVLVALACSEDGTPEVRQSRGIMQPRGDADDGDGHADRLRPRPPPTGDAVVSDGDYAALQVDVMGAIGIWQAEPCSKLAPTGNDLLAMAQQ